MTELSEDVQSAYHIGRISPTADVDADVFEAMRRYLVEDCGIDSGVATKRANAELSRRIPIDVIDFLSTAGIQVKERIVLDLGAGLGAMSEELVVRGAHVTALEPGAAWAALTQRRVERHQGEFKLLRAAGECIPLPACSMDLIVSLQVLEHVNDPPQVLAEAWRVLRPGGHFYLACENYLAFREGHYQVPWFPLLPKTVASAYLRVLGRSPVFLQESVTYTTYPGVLRDARRLGFIRLGDEQLAMSLKTKTGLKWDALRGLARLTAGRGPYWLDLMRNAFKFGISELFRKPGA
jgi:SAM-dependent methyltransferase